MSWANRRKLLYFFASLIVLAVIITIPALTLFHHAATCNDGVQNQNEDGIDCGGPCINLCQNLEQAPVIRWQQTLKVTATSYTTVAYIYNGNAKAEAFNVPYTFTFYNNQNVVISTTTGYSNIPPGKSIAIVIPNLSFTTDIPVRTDFEFTQNPQWKQARSQPDFRISNLFYSDTSGFPTVDADITNDSSFSVGRTNVTVIIYDTNDNAIAASKTYFDTFTKQATQHVTFTWPNIFQSTISRIEVIPTVQ